MVRHGLSRYFISSAKISVRRDVLPPDRPDTGVKAARRKHGADHTAGTYVVALYWSRILNGSYPIFFLPVLGRRFFVLALPSPALPLLMVVQFAAVFSMLRTTKRARRLWYCCNNDVIAGSAVACAASRRSLRVITVSAKCEY